MTGAHSLTTPLGLDDVLARAAQVLAAYTPKLASRSMLLFESGQGDIVAIKAAASPEGTDLTVSVSYDDRHAPAGGEVAVRAVARGIAEAVSGQAELGNADQQFESVARLDATVPESVQALRDVFPRGQLSHPAGKAAVMRLSQGNGQHATIEIGALEGSRATGSQMRITVMVPGKGAPAPAIQFIGVRELRLIERTVMSRLLPTARSVDSIELTDLVDGVLAMEAPRAGQHRVSLRNDVPDGVVVRGPTQQLHQVLTNLVSNGIKYNREGGCLTIRADCEGGRARIEVEDTGRGLSETEIGKLFQPYERLGAENTKIDGNGLGLVIVRDMVEAMGGKMGVTGRPGVGSTFWLDMPGTQRLVKAPDATPTPPEPQRDGRRAGDGAFVLS